MKHAVPEVSAEEAFARSASGEVVMVDVREPDEWEAGHIPGALHIPLGELEARWPELRASDSVIVVCRSGNRSATAAQALLSVGIDPTTSARTCSAPMAAGLAALPISLSDSTTCTRW